MATSVDSSVDIILPSLHRCLLARLQHMRRTKRESDRAGEFLVFARLFLKRANWAKAKAHWFDSRAAYAGVRDLLKRVKPSHSRARRSPVERIDHAAYATQKVESFERQIAV